MKITQNTILITGGTSGIGKEFVRQFDEYNNQIIVASSNADKLEKLKEEFPKIETIVCNLGNQQDVKRLIDICLEHHQGINMIINNAGIQINGSWLNSQDSFQQISNETTINFISPMQITQGLLPLLKDKRESAVVNISSALAFAPKKSALIYCGTKAAMHISTKSLRYQLKNTSVKVFEIIPPLVDTGMTKDSVKSKMSPEKLVHQFLVKFQKNQYEISIGKAKLLRFIQRIYPKGADNILKNG